MWYIVPWFALPPLGSLNRDPEFRTRTRTRTRTDKSFDFPFYFLLLFFLLVTDFGLFSFGYCFRLFGFARFGMLSGGDEWGNDGGARMVR
uniref:Uncharacterized protein n=1 Tax=Gossypium raimondii TaxID=29730 RepID=A0A0D2R6B2_GOSRA|nr:hypothetical protein B456_008G002100 [Gossypium raimondii]